jgi:hypothetical protein
LAILPVRNFRWKFLWTAVAGSFDIVKRCIAACLIPTQGERQQMHVNSGSFLI